ncbi:hypothetical protein WN51_11701 [Melipona quadrifasciata]|uniref:Uncharacterized protein n=1 Tax=Melipona quadrifasciata TaxID=166423 RepID=A0A0M9A384_9HYME|nr:hypothetical protein WN51_11701 [Melipona quadrifasciata]
MMIFGLGGFREKEYTIDHASFPRLGVEHKRSAHSRARNLSWMNERSTLMYKIELNICDR